MQQRVHNEALKQRDNVFIDKKSTTVFYEPKTITLFAEKQTQSPTIVDPIDREPNRAKTAIESVQDLQRRVPLLFGG